MTFSYRNVLNTAKKSFSSVLLTNYSTAHVPKYDVCLYPAPSHFSLVLRLQFPYKNSIWRMESGEIREITVLRAIIW